MQVDLLLEPGRELRKPPVEFFELGRLAQLLTQEKLAVDELDGELTRLLEVRVASQIRFGRDPLTSAPTFDLIIAESVHELSLRRTGLARPV